ncbi:hypothetical protein Ancab_012780 [Ancistrocladus abbreviatus]
MSSTCQMKLSKYRLNLTPTIYYKCTSLGKKAYGAYKSQPSIHTKECQPLGFPCDGKQAGQLIPETHFLSGHAKRGMQLAVWSCLAEGVNNSIRAMLCQIGA